MVWDQNYRKIVLYNEHFSALMENIRPISQINKKNVYNFAYKQDDKRASAYFLKIEVLNYNIQIMYYYL